MSRCDRNTAESTPHLLTTLARRPALGGVIHVVVIGLTVAWIVPTVACLSLRSARRRTLPTQVWTALSPPVHLGQFTRRCFSARTEHSRRRFLNSFMNLDPRPRSSQSRLAAFWRPTPSLDEVSGRTGSSSRWSACCRPSPAHLPSPSPPRFVKPVGSPRQAHGGRRALRYLGPVARARGYGPVHSRSTCCRTSSEPAAQPTLRVGR